MNPFLLLISLMGALLLSACSPSSSENQPSATSDIIPASPVEDLTLSKTVQTLTSRDNKIKIIIQNGHFTDISNQRSQFPENVTPQELTLLQHDPQSNITLYTSALGAPQTDAKTYFLNLKEALQSAEGLDHVRVGMATDNRMNYQFSQINAQGSKLTENCIAIHEAQLYNICASSTTASNTELAAVLTDVNLIK